MFDNITATIKPLLAITLSKDDSKSIVITLKQDSQRTGLSFFFAM